MYNSHPSPISKGKEDSDVAGRSHVFQGSQSLALSGFLIKTPYIGVILAEKHESGLSFDRDISEMGVFDIL